MGVADPGNSHTRRPGTNQARPIMHRGHKVVILVFVVSAGKKFVASRGVRSDALRLRARLGGAARSARMRQDARSWRVRSVEPWRAGERF